MGVPAERLLLLGRYLNSMAAKYLFRADDVAKGEARSVELQHADAGPSQTSRPTAFHSACIWSLQWECLLNVSCCWAGI